jgi:hypothetical protein
MKKKLTVIVALFSAGLILFDFAYPPKKESGKLLADWISVQLKLVRTTKGVPHVAFSRHFAYTAIAFYESVIPGDKNYLSLSGQLQNLEKLPQYQSKVSFSSEACSNAAYAEMLRYYYGKNSNARLIDSLETVNGATLQRTGINKESLTASSDFGKTIAKAIILWSETDGSEKANAPYNLPAGEGLWQLTPPNFVKAAVPYWKNNRSLVKGSTENKITSFPPKYSTDANSDYYKMVKEVFDVSQSLTAEQKSIAWFWDDSPGKYLSVPGHWSSILAQVIKNNNLSLTTSAEAFIKMHIALHDAAIVAWGGKYTYNVLRPITNIQNWVKRDWQSEIETPSHPEFPAAHATLSSAAATGLTSVLGDTFSFSDATYSDIGMQARSFSSFNSAAQEAGLSRLYGGIHYRFSIDEGLKIGSRTADAVFVNLKFKP